jgi:hypothetical protein
MKRQLSTRETMPRPLAARRASNSAAEMILALKEQLWSTCEPHPLGLNNERWVTMVDRLLHGQYRLGPQSERRSVSGVCCSLGKMVSSKATRSGTCEMKKTAWDDGLRLKDAARMGTKAWWNAKSPATARSRPRIRQGHKGVLRRAEPIEPEQGNRRFAEERQIVSMQPKKILA